jgi:hypothetical protein
MVGEEEPWLQSARAALVAAAVDDEELLVEAMGTILNTQGLRYAEDMMLFWADNCPHPHVDHLTEPDEEFQFFDTSTGAALRIEDCAPDTQWAGELLIARWKGDDDRVRRLLASIPGPHEMLVYATIVLHMCGHLVSILGSERAELAPALSDEVPEWAGLAGEALSAEVGDRQLLANEMTLALLLKVPFERHMEIVHLWAEVTVRAINAVRGDREVNWGGEGFAWVDDYLRAVRRGDADTAYLVIAGQCRRVTGHELVTQFRQGCGARVRQQAHGS